MTKNHDGFIVCTGVFLITPDGRLYREAIADDFQKGKPVFLVDLDFLDQKPSSDLEGSIGELLNYTVQGEVVYFEGKDKGALALRNIMLSQDRRGELPRYVRMVEGRSPSHALTKRELVSSGSHVSRCCP